jgi:EamA-like transporter family
MRRHLTNRGTTPIALAAAQIGVGALMLIITAPVLAAQAVDLHLDVVASVLAYLLNYHLIHDEGATTASTVTYLLPIVAVILGAIVLGEPITWNLFVGAAIVLAGVAASDRRFSRPRTTARSLTIRAWHQTARRLLPLRLASLRQRGAYRRDCSSGSGPETGEATAADYPRVAPRLCAPR